MFFKKRQKEDETSLFSFPSSSQQESDARNLDNSIETNIIELNVQTTETTKKVSMLPHVFVAVSAFFASVSGGLCEGYSQVLFDTLNKGKDQSLNTMVVSNEDWFYYAFMIGWVAGSVPIGCFTILGRKKTLILGMVLRMVGWILVTFANSYSTLLCGRILLGVGVGMNYVLLSVYITEVCHSSVRGTVAASIPVGIQTGLLLIYIAGSYVKWRDLAEMSLVITIVCFAPLLLLPESPVWLALRGQHEKAKDSLLFLRGKRYNFNPELTQIVNCVSDEVPLCEDHSHGGKRHLRLLIVLASFIIVDKLCGRPAIITFTITFFKRIDNPINPRASYILIAFLQLCGAGISGTIIDWAGRKLLTLLSLVMMGSTLVLMVIFLLVRNLKETEWDLRTGWVPLVILLVYVLAYSFGIGMSVYILIGELIPITSSDCYVTFISLLCGAVSFLTPSSHSALMKILTVDGSCILYALTCLWCALYAAGCHKETSKLNYEELNLLSDGCLQMQKLGET